MGKAKNGNSSAFEMNEMAPTFVFEESKFGIKRKGHNSSAGSGKRKATERTAAPLQDNSQDPDEYKTYVRWIHH